MGLCGWAYAQFSAGIHSGLAFSNIEMKGNLGTLQNATDALVSPQVGAFAQYEWSPGIALRSGIQYVQRGLTIHERTHLNVFDIPIPVGISTDLRIKYLEIPLEVVYRRNFGHFAPYVTAGAGVAQALDARLQPRVTALLDFNLPDVNINLEDFNSTTVFGKAGMGISYQTAGGSLFIEGTYRHDFETLKPNFLVDLDLKNKGFSVGIGYVMSF